MTIELQGEIVQLLPEKALWWPKEKTLIVADLHWGKSAHFRKHGIAVPLQSQTGDEIRLAGCIRQYGAERLIIAGDLFHSHSNHQVDVFAHFRTHHQELQIDLVTGNHDILPEEYYDTFDLIRHEEALMLPPFTLAHDYLQVPGFLIHGHVHPACVIHGKGRQGMRLPCFAIDRARMILPAFGSFTGTYTVDARQWNRLYVIADSSVIQWK